MAEGARSKVRDRLPGGWSASSVPKPNVSRLLTAPVLPGGLLQPSQGGTDLWTSISSSVKWACEKQRALLTITTTVVLYARALHLH